MSATKIHAKITKNHAVMLNAIADALKQSPDRTLSQIIEAAYRGLLEGKIKPLDEAKQ